MQNNPTQKGSVPDGAEQASAQKLTTGPAGRLGRRGFLKRVGLSGTVLLPASGILASKQVVRAAGFSRGLTRGDAAILRFLAAIEIIESDLWQQYNEVALGNESYQQALTCLMAMKPPT